jgi:hypothetical protein
MRILTYLALGLLSVGTACDNARSRSADASLTDGKISTPRTDSEVCAQVNVKLDAAPPTVVLLIDKSGSMVEPFGNTSRWEAVYTTLMDPQAGIVIKLQDKVRFGLTLYTSDYGFSGGTCPILTQVAPALSNYQAMNAVYQPVQLKDEGDTPTGESIQAVAAQLKLVTDPGRKVIVLATDGVPDTCADPDGNGQDLSLSAAQAAFADGITTAIISVGDQVNQDHLQQMANVGAGLPAEGSTKAPYYQALDSQQLLAAFNEILGNVRTCQFKIEGRIKDIYASQGKVVLDGQTLSYGTDWKLSGDSTLEILGTPCQTILAGGDHTLAASFPCQAILR